MPSISKQTTEKLIYFRFRDAYFRTTNIYLGEEHHQDAPDFIAFDKESRIKYSIEITGVYQNSEEAMIQYWRQEGWEGFFKGDQTLIVQAFNKVIGEKSKISYGFENEGKLLLVINLGSLVFNQLLDIEYMRPQINIPKNNFDEIWVLFRDEIHEFDIYKLK